MRDYSRIRYWVDELGYLWHGPVCPKENMHYARFEGYMVVAPWHPIWVLMRSDEPVGCEEITEDQARGIMEKHYEDRPGNPLMEVPASRPMDR